MTRVRPVVLSGGSGTRLWPLSVRSRPKQFLQLVDDVSLFDATVKRARALPGESGVIVVTGSTHVPLVSESLDDREATVLVEPGPRNTAPAIVAAALTADPDDIMVILPSDHLIRDVSAFLRAAETAIDLANAGRIVTFGCVPDRPEVGYGWIKPGDDADGGFVIEEFVEKPDIDTAVQMLGEGYLWNSGMFVARAEVILSEARSTPNLVEAVRGAMPDRGSELTDRFLAAPSISFDHAVMEKTSLGTVVPLDAGWSDIGSWQAVWESSAHDSEGNVLEGEAYVLDARNSLIHASTRPVAVVGVEDLVVIETADGVLVIPRQRSQQVREVGKHIEDRNG